MKEIRTVETHPNRWGEPKVHAAMYTRHPEIFVPHWAPICKTSVYTKNPVKVPRPAIPSIVTCKRCLKILERMANG